jgi:ABC-type dipeptide/oligopeptide/nickel transport system permease subunit
MKKETLEAGVPESDPARGTEGEEILSPSKLAWQGFRRNTLGMAGGLLVLALLVLSAVGPYVTPYSDLEMISADAFQGPSSRHLAGTDRFGRDQLSRIVVGTRTSLVVSFGATVLAMVIGTLLGLVSGYYGGRLDNVIMRLLDIVFAFPSFLLALAMVAALGPGIGHLLVIIGVIFSARFARVVRGSVLSVKEKEYVEAGRSAGATDWQIMTRFILPNVVSPVIVQATFYLSTAIMMEAGLSFLGLGTQPPTPSWGLMLNESRSFMELAPWLAIFPGLAIVVSILAFNFLGDGLRDALDPRLFQR